MFRAVPTTRDAIHNEKTIELLLLAAKLILADVLDPALLLLDHLHSQYMTRRCESLRFVATHIFCLF